MIGSPHSASRRDEINSLIWRAVANIPSGCVATYGQIADRAGLGRAARRVGRALRDLPPDSQVPWHRVIRAGGRLAFPAGSEAYRRQTARLAEEGVTLLNGRIDLARFGWQQTLDELLWKPDE